MNGRLSPFFSGSDCHFVKSRTEVLTRWCRDRGGCIRLSPCSFFDLVVPALGSHLFSVVDFCCELSHFVGVLVATCATRRRMRIFSLTTDASALTVKRKVGGGMYDVVSGLWCDGVVCVVKRRTKRSRGCRSHFGSSHFGSSLAQASFWKRWEVWFFRPLRCASASALDSCGMMLLLFAFAGLHVMMDSASVTGEPTS